MSEANFMGLALNGRVVSDEIDDFVAAWHASDDPQPLHEFLGMSWEEYQLWVSDPAYLNIILAARHNGEDLRHAVQAVNDHFRSPDRIAARSTNPERVRQLEQWLAKNG